MSTPPVRRSRNQAFTLIEILGTILIIAVLVALMMPSMKKALVAAASARCIGNLRQISGALVQFSADNNGQVIPYALAGQGSYHPGYVIDGYLDVTPKPSYAISKVWSCPMNPPTIFPPDKDPSDAGVSYAVNINLLDTVNILGSPSAVVRSPSKCLMVLEKDASKEAQIFVTALSPQLMKNQKAGFYKHGGGNTVAFVDGHIEQLPREHLALEGWTKPKEYMPYWDPQWTP